MAPPAPAVIAARKFATDNAGVPSACVALGLEAASTSQIMGKTKTIPSAPSAVFMANLSLRARPQRRGPTAGSGGLSVAGAGVTSRAGICSVVMGLALHFSLGASFLTAGLISHWPGAQGGAGGH